MFALFLITVNLVVATLPDEYAHRTLQFVAKQLEATQHVQFYLQWACQLITLHGPKEDVLSAHTLLALQQNLSRKYEQLSKVCDFNKYTMRVLRSVDEPKSAAEAAGDDDDEEERDDDLMLVRLVKDGQSNDDDDMESDDENDTSSDE